MKTTLRPCGVDFETHAIEERPRHPPVPVGVSIKHFGKPAKYYAWGHTTKNNCGIAEAKRALKEAWASPDGILCHHAKFDVEVAVKHMGMKMLPWDKVHDTLFLMFLDDPHQPDLGLKSGAERYLGDPPAEKDAVGLWLIEHQPAPGVNISDAKRSDNYFMKFLPLAPGDLVGRYANGDTSRAEGIFKKLYPSIVERGMLEAYNRERRLMPILLANEQQGIRVDLKRLSQDVLRYNKVREEVRLWICKQLKTPGLNLNSGDQLAKALIAAGKADKALLGVTPGGKIQTNKEAIDRGVTDLRIASALKYFAQVSTCVGTFMEPWLEVAEETGGLIHTSWNQTRATDSGTGVGARTGRLSSSPNFMNIPNEFKDLWWAVKNKKLPKCPFKDLPPPPMCRDYIVPMEKDHVIIDRDFQSQEPRILAHFEGGKLLAAYTSDNWMDIHNSAQSELAKIGLFYDRKPVKNTNLGLIYGMGVGKLAEKNNMSVEEAKVLKNAMLALYPGLKEMYQDMKRRAISHEPIRTWGGRQYYCEEPRLIQGQVRHFDYKLVNQLIQGSAADATKESIIRYHEAKKDNHLFMLSVHDQNAASVPKKELKTGMEVLRRTMESIEFDVPLLSEGSWSPTTWAKMLQYDKKGIVTHVNV